MHYLLIIALIVIHLDTKWDPNDTEFLLESDSNNNPTKIRHSKKEKKPRGMISPKENKLLKG